MSLHNHPNNLALNRLNRTCADQLRIMSSGSDASLSEIQQVGIYGVDPSGVWNALALNSEGHLEINISGETGLANQTNQLLEIGHLQDICANLDTLYTVNVSQDQALVNISGYLDSIDTNLIICDTNNVVGTFSASGNFTETNSAAILADTTALVAKDFATETTLSALNGKVTAVDTGAVVIASGSVTETNSADILTNLQNIDLTTVNMDSNISLLLGIDYASETTLSALDAKVTAVDTGNVVVSSGTVTINTVASTRKSRVVYEDSAVAGDVYVLLIDLDNTGGEWPHAQFNSIDVDHIASTISFASGTAEAIIRVGIITRIDGTDADISYLINHRVGAQQSNDSAQVVCNYQPSSVVFKGDGGTGIEDAITSVKESGVAAVNTGTGLPSPAGTTTPATGDVILKLEYVADTYAANVDVIYHSD
jgi:hypothetical protein